MKYLANSIDFPPETSPPFIRKFQDIVMDSIKWALSAWLKATRSYIEGVMDSKVRHSCWNHNPYYLSWIQFLWASGAQRSFRMRSSRPQYSEEEACPTSDIWTCRFKTWRQMPLMCGIHKETLGRIFVLRRKVSSPADTTWSSQIYRELKIQITNISWSHARKLTFAFISQI